MANYLLLDAARTGFEAIEVATEIIKAADTAPQSLYIFNANTHHLQIVAPYLYEDKGEGLDDWYMGEGWGNSWGIKVVADAPYDVVRYHFRKFLKVQTEDMRTLIFRFYDPRVLRVFLPSCDAKQLKEFFGPVRQFVCEGSDPAEELVFSLGANGLQTGKRMARKVAAKRKRHPAKIDAMIAEALRNAGIEAPPPETPLADNTQGPAQELQSPPLADAPPAPVENAPKPKRRFFYD